MFALSQWCFNWDLPWQGGRRVAEEGHNKSLARAIYRAGGLRGV
eukprot:CAMPEP_0184525022 /NCGR_PEP_ID=MMETSP0198_2-20121128/9855_1 /TAXON_ID=1112570 /ORGANISM="Thraustochytrium sp., Strain LLF1b" /LENGTH=43 /DNA_ID= /DNA_START= /DNA_END= /DNA_ORIENTATION=